MCEEIIMPFQDFVGGLDLCRHQGVITNREMKLLVLEYIEKNYKLAIPPIDKKE